MSTNPNMVTVSRATSGAAKRRGGQIAGVVVAAVILGALVYAIWFRGEEDRQRVSVFIAKRGQLTIDVSQSGTIQNRDLVILKNEVEGRTTVLWLIPEGTVVKKDDLLVELDGSDLEDRKTQQQITVDNTEAAFIRARENRAVTQSQGESDVAKAELAFRFAKLDLKKYKQGEYPEEVQECEADITIAREELQRASDKLEWSRQLEEEGYLTQTELMADKLAVKRSQINLQLAESKLKLLKQFTYERTLQQLESDVEQTEKALERDKRKAAADNVQASAELKAKESEYEWQKGKLDKIVEQITKCKIEAPVAGRAIYATTGRGHWRMTSEPLAEGQQVHERQELIYLPTTTSMMAEVKIPESSLRKIQVGMPVRITVEALPDQRFTGRVGKIAWLPDAISAWLNPDSKVYITQVHITSDASSLRLGMSCRTEIIVHQYADAVYVPIQSVVRVEGQSVVYVRRSDGTDEMREVEVGLDNNRMVNIISGLAEGEEVLLAPPLAPSVKSPEEQKGPEGGEGVGGAKGPPATQPAPADSPARPPEEPAGPAQMTPEQRTKWLESLTPEQRQAREKRRAQQAGRPAKERTGGQ